jgi:hypothetical protein
MFREFHCILAIKIAGVITGMVITGAILAGGRIIEKNADVGSGSTNPVIMMVRHRVIGANRPAIIAKDLRTGTAMTVPIVDVNEVMTVALDVVLGVVQVGESGFYWCRNSALMQKNGPMQKRHRVKL